MPHFKTYIDRPVTDSRGIIRDARRLLKEVEFDTFVATGISGAVVAPMLAHAMKKSFLIIRKDDDRSTHCGSQREVGILGDRWIFVDDFVSSGATLNRVLRHVQELRTRDSYDFELMRSIEGAPVVTEYVGAFTYGVGVDPKSTWSPGATSPADTW